MLSRQEYHKAFIKAYQKSPYQKYLQLYRNTKNILFAMPILFLPIIFTFMLDIFLVNNQYHKPEIILKTNIFTDKTNYNNIPERVSFNLKNKYNNIPDHSYENYYSKNKSSKDPISLDKINLDSPETNFPTNISERKSKFIEIILPLAVNQNQQILSYRQRLIEIKESLNFNKTLNKKDQNFLNNLASKYLVITKNRHKIDIINDLLITVDIIPASIVIAQAANESGWGSSRFAKEYNAVFGEYTYNNKIGIVPAKREKGKKHLIKSFSSIDQSVESYFKNINTHSAYNEFRILRKILRNKFNTIDSNLLINKLNVYAIDNNYVNTIRSIIKTNKLKQYDNIQSLISS